MLLGQAIILLNIRFRVFRLPFNSPVYFVRKVCRKLPAAEIIPSVWIQMKVDIDRQMV